MTLIDIVELKADHLKFFSSLYEDTDKYFTQQLKLADRQPDIYKHLAALDTESGSQPAGHLGICIAENQISVTRIGTLEQFQGKFIATQLLIAGVRLGIQAGAESLGLEVRVSNQRAQKIYSRFGLVPAGARNNYYRNPKEDALVMWNPDIQSKEFSQLLNEIEVQIGRCVELTK